jgi:SpoVK/Ycf46/Vps4 family AAA+-type ATPase
MFIFEVEPSYQSSVVKYIYTNKQYLVRQDNDDIHLYASHMFKDEENNYELNIGEYEFNYNDSKIFISYSLVGDVKATSYNLSILKKLILKCDSEEIFTKLYNEALDKKSKKEEKKINIYYSDKHGEWIIYSKIPSRNLDSIYIDNELKDRVKTDIKNFIDSEEEYDRFGIPYKKTYLLTGVPGSGKTSFIKAICHEFGYHLCMLSMSKEFDNQCLMNAFKYIEKKSILLIEDIDSLFDKRNSSRENPLISFSNLINLLDGVFYKHGIIIFITTNHPELLDNAMLRMGRMDMIIQVNYPKTSDIKRLFVDLLKNKCVDQNMDSLFDKFYNHIKGQKITMSAIVNFLFRYRNKFEEHIDELIDTNDFISKSIGENKEALLYN